MLVTSRALAHDAEHGEPIAIRDADSSLSYAQLSARAARIAALASGWRDDADPRSPYVAVLSDWTPEFIACVLGLVSAGLAVGVCDPAWSPDEIAGALDQLDPCACLVDDGRSAQLEGFTRRAWRTVDRWEPGWSVLATRKLGSGEPTRPVGPDEPFYVGFTSGSSGRPKAFVRSHRSWWESFEAFGALHPFDPDGVVLVPGPLSGSHFLFGALHALHVGATLELVAPRALARRLARGPRVSALYVVPTMLAGLATSKAGAVYDPGFVFCSGARLDPEVIAATRTRLPRTHLVEYYGASELSFVAIRRHGDGTPAGSVGKAFPGVEISVRDENDVVVGPGVDGTIFARSSLTFAGYRGMAPPSAARRIDGDWWTAGDRGALDDAGYLYVAGRGSNLIISGGANVQPEEVERVLEESPGVAACVVVGLPDPTWGEIVCAAIVPAADAAMRRADLRDHAARLAPYKRPRRYVALDGSVPLGRTGKVDRQRVRELVIDSGTTWEIR